MNLIDLAAAFAVLWCGLSGLRKGFVREGLEAASAVGGVLAAFRLHGRYAATAAARLQIPEELLRPALLFLIAAGLTAAGLAASALAARAVPREGAAASVDVALGFLFGAAKGLLFTLLILGGAAEIPSGFVAAALEGSLAGRAAYALLPGVYRYVHSVLQGG